MFVYLLRSVNESCFHEVVKCAGVKSKVLAEVPRLEVALKVYLSFESFVMIKRMKFAGKKSTRDCVLKAGCIP